MSRQTTSPLKALLNVEASASVPKLSNAQMLCERREYNLV